MAKVNVMINKLLCFPIGGVYNDIYIYVITSFCGYLPLYH